jgi:mono/diheme cytochrome c family protein
VVAKDERVLGWVAGEAVYAADGKTPWVVGVDAAGSIHRLRAMTAFEDVTARYGLVGKRVRGVTVIGPGRLGFLLDGQIALSDASTLALFTTPRFSALAGGGGFSAGLTKDTIDVVNATNGIVTRFALPGVDRVALDARGRLHASTRRAIYAADGAGALQIVYDAGRDGLHGLVASGDRVWFADRGELGIVEGDHVAETSGANIGAEAKLQASPSGDVWVIDRGKLARFAAVGRGEAAAAGTATTWSSTVKPVFARACAACHQPNSASGIDLSTEAAWQLKRALVRTRVIVDHTMPPRGHAISDADRAAIHAWIEGGH